MKPKKTKTSYSISLDAWMLLQEASTKLGISYSGLIIWALRRFSHKMNNEPLPGTKGTATYNSAPPAKTITVRWESNEHLNLRSIRLLTGLSISYLLSGIIMEFIPKVLRRLEKKGVAGLNLSDGAACKLECALKAIHFTYRYSAKNLSGLALTKVRFRGRYANPSRFLRNREESVQDSS